MKNKVPVEYFENLSIDFIRQHWKTLPKDQVIMHSKLDEEFIRDFWPIFTEKQKANVIMFQTTLDEDFIRANVNLFSKREWGVLSKWVKLSYSFVREFIDYIDFNKFLMHSETKDINIIREYNDIIDWNIISAEINSGLMWDEGRDLICSNKFIKEFWDKLEGYII